MSGKLPQTYINPRESDERYRYFVEGTHDLVQSVSPAGEIVFVNKSWEQTLGYTEADRITLNLFDIIHPDSRQLCREIFDKILEGESIESVEVVFIKKDGSTVMLDGNIFPFILEGKVIATQGFFHDITARKKADSEKFTFLEELKKSEQKYRALVERVSDGFLSLDNNWCFTYMNKKAGEILAIDPENNIGKNIWQEFPHWTDTLFYKAFHEAKASQRHVYLEEYHPDNDTWIENHFYPSAEGVSIFFKNITKKKKTENELKVSEQLFRNMIENISEAVYTCDEWGYIHVYNKAAVKLWGREPLIGTDRWTGSWKMMNTEGIEMKPENSPMATAVKEKRPVLGKEVLIQRRDGSIRHVLPSPTPLFNASGKLTGAVNMLFDITDKKEREVLIKTTEAKYRDLFEQASDAIVTYSLDGKIYEFNDIICSMSGYTKEEFQKLRLSDILVGEIIMSKTKYEEILSGKTVTLFRQCKHKHGALVDMEFKTRLIHGNQVLAIGRDITERKRNEEIIKKANERYEILAKATSDTIWDWDILHDKMLYNYGNRNMFGHKHTEIEKVSEWWKKNIHPSDLYLVIENLEQTYSKRQHLIQLEYRFRCADGTYKYILDRGFVIYDEEGKPIRMIGAMQDITKEKEHERQIAVAIMDTQEKERRELGMELHDNVNQLLTATLLYLGMATKSSLAGNEVSKTLNECAGYINEAINDIRNLSHRLTPYTNDEVSLKEILKWITDPIEKTTPCEINLEVDEFSDTMVSKDIQTNIYRITQEQLTNILKHARAGKVGIQVQLTAENIILTITDNGIGFDTAIATKGIGLQNIKRRAELFSGICTITSSPGNGCEVKVEIPVGKD